MSEDAATEWLAVAFREVSDFAKFRAAAYEGACKTARQQCTHHGQIVPHILSKRLYEWENESDWLKLTGQNSSSQFLSESPEIAKIVHSTGNGLKKI